VRLRSGTIVVFLGLCVPYSTGAQNWQWAVSERLTRERVIGLLALPEIVAPECAPSEPGRASLYANPSKSTAPLGAIERAPDGECQILVRHAAEESEEQLPTDESSYETPAAIVYQRQGSWFRIALQHGSSWVRRDNPHDFLPYPQLFRNRLAYIREGWDATLWNMPGVSVPTPLPTKWKSYAAQNVPMTYLGFRRLASELWIHVRLESESCGEPLEGVKPVEGWIRAYRRTGETSAWFYSRGC
jgi:hypothetical protein